MVAPEDGRIINLQVRPGIVSGEYRIGAIASFICEADRYLLANDNQESLKFVASGQPVEVALNLYPGPIFKASVEAIWKASGTGQMLPSGTQGAAAICTGGMKGGWAALRRIGIRTCSWLNCLYPIRFDETHFAALRAVSRRRH